MNFHYRLKRGGKVVREGTVKNTVVREGMEYLSDVLWDTQTPGSSWKIGLIDGDPSGLAVSVLDTLGSHVGWSEMSGVTRQTWNKQSSPTKWAFEDWRLINQAVTPAEFEFSSPGVVGGFFLTDETRLWAASLLEGDGTTDPDEDINVFSGDTLEVSYTTGVAANE